MCGLAIIYSLAYCLEFDRHGAMLAMCAHMKPRGPDAQGIWHSENIIMGHRRLSIIDLNPRSNQPMHSMNGRFVIVFNGEIYNFRDLKTMCELEGDDFSTNSDTEVLLALYARHGENMLPKLRGMFSIAIYDTLSHELFLARDPYGIKPLYYAKTKYGVLIASQVKTILASGVPFHEQETAGIAGFYLWGSVPEPWTLYKGIFALPSGSFMRIREGVTYAPTRWFDISNHWCNPCSVTSSEIELPQVQIQSSVTDSIQTHLISDVPLCVFLGGGIDSSVILAIASQINAKIRGITIAFNDFNGNKSLDESVPATFLAEYYGVPHTVRRVNQIEFLQDLPKILTAMDQPSIDGVNTWFASKAASELGYKVALSGIGADELFCGYPTFSQIPFRACVGSALLKISKSTISMNGLFVMYAKFLNQPKFHSVPSFMGSIKGQYQLQRGLFMPTDLPELMGIDAALEGIARLNDPPEAQIARDDLCCVGLLESTRYLKNQLLKDSDWASMAHSLELRTPFVDSTLLAKISPFISNFKFKNGKRLLSKTPIKKLPAAISNRPKSGFGIPLTNWLNTSSLQSQSLVASNEPLSKTPISRIWAKIVMKHFMGI